MIGETISHYKITEKLGQGGMGEVYRATDTKLNRDVALKLLPEQFASDSQRMARFQREAEVLASLDHPNIGQIYGIENAGQTKVLVLQLIEGPTLAERIAQGPIPVEDALKIALQITEGLEAAHEKGVIHRDLKPANIKITPEGQVKILDFGLAKALEVEVPASSLSQSPTLTNAATQAGVILGTAAYMSPEQAKGKQIDTRADTWGFGALVYEMFTGKRAFEGEDVSDTLAAVLRAEVDWSKLPFETPASLRRLLERCLSRDLRRRLADIREARIAIEDYLANPAAESGIEAVGPVPPAWQRWLPWAGMALFALTTLVVSLWMVNVDSAPPLRKLYLAEAEASSPLISPDGNSIAFLKDNSIWIRRLDQLESRKLEGTDEGTDHFWSPDSRFLGFVRDSQLWKISVAQASPQVICDIPPGPGPVFHGASWGADETIVFSKGASGLFRVSSGGGDPELFLEYGLDDGRFRDPHLLPDGKGILFVQRDRGKIELFDGRRRQVVLEREGALLTDPIYSMTGHLIFSRGSSNEGIWAVPFSLSELKVTGDHFRLTAEVGTPSVSHDASLVYLPGSVSRHQLVWVSRAGEVLETISQAQQSMRQPALSPDETKIAVSAREQGSPFQIWIHDIERMTKRPLTFASDLNISTPFWDVQGQRVAYSEASGDFETALLYIKAVDESSPKELLVEGYGGSVSSDGKYLIYWRMSESQGWDLWYLQMEGDQTPQLFLQTPSNEDSHDLSPDGNYLAFESDESGQDEVYLKRFPSGEGLWLVSTRGGRDPFWSKDRDELHSWEGEDLMVVEVDTTGSDPLRSNPQRLFSAAEIDVVTIAVQNRAISRDGRFLLIQNVQKQGSQESQPSIVITQNWFAEFEGSP